MSLEDRVAILESQVAAMLVGSEGVVRAKDWRRTLGRFSGDETMKRIDEAALQYREEDREKARREFLSEDGTQP